MRNAASVYCNVLKINTSREGYIDIFKPETGLGALVFRMPQQAQEQSTPNDAAGEPDEEDNELEHEVNALEADLGYDLDGDGDVGTTGARDAQQLSAKLKISHEAWVACERIIESDLVLRHVIPIDQRFLVRSIVEKPIPPVCHGVFFACRA